MKFKFRSLIDLLGSFGLASALILMLFILTLFGTLEQQYSSLFEVQKKYFESVFLKHEIGPFTLLMPGAGLVMALLGLNLLVGGLIRIRWAARTAGIIVIHIGVAMLLIAGAVKLWSADEGYLQLFEGERSDEYISYHNWEVAIYDATATSDVLEYIIPEEKFLDLTGDRTASFSNPKLPFVLKLSNFSKNCRALPKGPNWESPYPVVDGYALLDLELAKEEEQNVAGMYASVESLAEGTQGTGEETQGILWSVERLPWTFEAGGKIWAVSLRHTRYNMPYTIELDDFKRDLHPRTGMAKSYESDVLKLDGAAQESINISMNNPLRDGGLVLFQSSWGPSDARPGEPLFSVFSVVRNPSDVWPEVAMWIIAAGSLLHFLMKLRKYFTRSSKRLADAQQAAGGTPS